MVDKLDYIKKIDDKDFTEYIFTVDGYDISYSISYLKRKDELFKYSFIYSKDFISFFPENTNGICEFDWDFVFDKPTEKINIHKIFKYINEIGKIYLDEKKPDYVIFDAEEKKFRIQGRLLENYGYIYVGKVENTYIFKRT